jgi:hypothetical protein
MERLKEIVVQQQATSVPLSANGDVEISFIAIEIPSGTGCNNKPGLCLFQPTEILKHHSLPLRYYQKNHYGDPLEASHTSESSVLVREQCLFGPAIELVAIDTTTEIRDIDLFPG